MLGAILGDVVVAFENEGVVVVLLLLLGTMVAAGANVGWKNGGESSSAYTPTNNQILAFGFHPGT
jgi:hypothetical protein